VPRDGEEHAHIIPIHAAGAGRNAALVRFTAKFGAGEDGFIERHRDTILYLYVSKMSNLDLNLYHYIDRHARTKKG
jgi:hypothetical protein